MTLTEPLVQTMNLAPVDGARRIYFVSDIHLGDGSHADIFQKKDEHLLAFLDHVEEQGDALIIVGDALDFDQAWYFERILRAHRAVLTRLTRLSESMRVIYVYGNHDPDIVLFRDFLKFELCDKVVVDHRLLAVHGYEYDTFVGENFEASAFWARVWMTYESVFKTWVRLPLRDHYTLSNRIAHFLFFHVARVTRWLRAVGPRLGRPDLGKGLAETVAFWTRGCLGDPMGLTRPVLEHLQQDPRYETVVCGHSHIPGVVTTEQGKQYVNLGSWSFGNAQYGVWNGRRMVVKDWITGREFADENYRHIFEGRADWTFEEWFHDQYLGYLRFRCGEEALRMGVRPRPWAVGPDRALSDLPTSEVSTGEAD
jgi:UDP-2,3-diacylglucosamine pyrophosphatase LpxH